MEMWGRWCPFDGDSAFRVRVAGISGQGEENLPRPGLAISDKGGLCRGKPETDRTLSTLGGDEALRPSLASPCHTGTRRTLALGTTGSSPS